MGVRKNKDSWWTDFRFGGVRIRKRSPENSKAGAEKYEAILKSRLACGEPLEGRKKAVAPLFKDFAEEWFNTHVMTNNKPSTQQSHRMSLDAHLLGHFGRMRLDAITTSEVERYKALKCQTSLAPKTINNQVAVLGKCLNSAVEWGRLPVAPRIKLLKVPPQKFTFLDPSESAALLTGFRDPRWQAMATCALRTGMRLGELLGLRWEDVDFERRQISVCRSIVRDIIGTPKSNKTRHIPMAQDLLGALAALRPKKGYVFQQANGEPMTRGMTERALKTACKRSKTRPIGWHALRHTFASQLACKGASIQVIKELLGHSDIKMTMRYAHLLPSTLRGAIDLLQADEIEPSGKFGQPVVNRPAETPETAPQDEVLEEMFLG